MGFNRFEQGDANWIIIATQTHFYFCVYLYSSAKLTALGTSSRNHETWLALCGSREISRNNKEISFDAFTDNMPTRLSNKNRDQTSVKQPHVSTLFHLDFLYTYRTNKSCISWTYFKNFQEISRLGHQKCHPPSRSSPGFVFDRPVESESCETIPQAPRLWWVSAFFGWWNMVKHRKKHGSNREKSSIKLYKYL